MSAVTLPAPSPIVQIPNGDSGVVYRAVTGFPGYAVGDDGNAWSRWKRRGLGIGRGSKSYLGGQWHLLTASRDRKGYRKVLLCNADVRRRVKLAVLVLETFVGPRLVGMESCHGPRGNADDRLDNVRWDTRLANDLDKVRNGTAPRGTQNNHNRLSEEQVREIREMAGTMTKTCIAQRFGVDRTTVSAILLGKSWAWLK